MSFLNIGPGEFFLVLVVALLIFGPERLPELARQAGKAVRDLRDMVRNLDPELLEDFRAMTEDLDTVRDEMKHIRSDMADIQKDLSGAARDVKKNVDDAVSTAKKTTSAALNEASGSTAKAGSSVTGQTAASTTASSPATSTASGTAAQKAATTPQATASSAAAARATKTPAPSHPKTSSSLAQGASQSSATAKTSTPVVEDEDFEIIGRPLPLSDNGHDPYPDEIMGEKTYPAHRSAARASRIERDNTAEAEQVAYRSPHAVMTSLAPLRISHPLAPAKGYRRANQGVIQKRITVLRPRRA